jgi:hypothetical protein
MLLSKKLEIIRKMKCIIKLLKEKIKINNYF